jgi:hypothetical protein
MQLVIARYQRGGGEHSEKLEILSDDLLSAER